MITTADRAKKLAAETALTEVASGMRLGLGTGSTVAFFLDALGAALASGRLSHVAGVPTSERTRRRCEALGIPLLELHGHDSLDLAVDGADEVAPNLSLIKGLGGAHLREKMVVQASVRFVVIADSGKLVSRLGEKAPVPVEVVPFEWRTHIRYFRGLGAEPEVREVDGAPFLTDNGNLVLDLYFRDGLPEPTELERALQGRAGVVETGLFLGMADRAFIASEAGVQTLDAPVRRSS